jgi:hypothetical protein
MSMPMTCTNKSTSVQQEHMPMLIPRILMSVNDKYTLPFCASCIKNICSQYAISEHNTTIAYIVELINTQPMSHIDSLALFFLLLNVDTQLKQSMMVSESETQRSKLYNFFMNLRKHIIPDFMANEQCTSSAFVSRCSDAWSVACVFA